MGILDRISQIVRSNITDLMDTGVSATGAMEKLIVSLKSELREAVRQHAAARHELERIDSNLKTSKEGMDRFQTLAMDALNRGDDQEARRHLVRRRRQGALVSALEGERKNFSDLSGKLAQAIEALKARIDELSIRLSMLQARERQKNIASLDRDNRDILEDLSWDGVEETNIPPLSSIDPPAPGKGVGRASSNIQNEENMASGDQEIEDELAKLRDRIRNG